MNDEVNKNDMQILGKKLLNRYDSYDVKVMVEGRMHSIQVAVVNKTDFEFFRIDAGSHESMDHELFEKIKAGIMDSFLEE